MTGIRRQKKSHQFSDGDGSGHRFLCQDFGCGGALGGLSTVRLFLYTKHKHADISKQNRRTHASTAKTQKLT